LRKARSEARSLSFMDLAAPHDDVLTQKDQANAVFLLHGYALTELVQDIRILDLVVPRQQQHLA